MVRRPGFRRITVAALLASSFALVLVASGRAAAGDRVAAEALAPGSRSVQFSVQPNFTLGSYSGSTLSLKRHLASGNAIRFGVSMDLGSQSHDFGDVTADTSFSSTQSGAGDGNSISIGAGAYYLWYTRQAAPLHAYWGAGPTVSWSRGHDDRSQSQTLTAPGQPSVTFTSVDQVTSRIWRVGAAAAVGVEWLVAHRVGLFAEYGSSLVYSATNFTRRSTLTSTTASPRTSRFHDDGHRWDFSGSGGRLGVSAYY